MSEQTSKNFRAHIILELTKELIRNTEVYKKTVINQETEKILQQKEETEKKVQKEEIKNIPQKIDIPLIVHKKIKEEKKRVLELKKEDKQKELRLNQESAIKFIPRVPLQRHLKRIRIPELRLPETVSHFRPIPTSQYIDLEKLEPLIRDPLVKTIECNGSTEKIIVTGMMGRKNTNITLSKDEIDDIIAKFSEAARIPVFEGVFKVVFGKLILSAIVSDVVNSKFIIRKMSEMQIPIPGWR